MAKCRELKRCLDALPVEETEELDTSVIINPNARTLRSGTTIVQKEEEDQEGEEEELAIETETGTSLDPTEMVKKEPTSETSQVNEEVSVPVAEVQLNE